MIGSLDYLFSSYEAHGLEGESVDGTGTVLENCLHVALGTISLVFVEPILGPLSVGRDHQAIPRHLGDDAGKRAGVHTGVTFNPGATSHSPSGGDRCLVTVINDEALVCIKAVLLSG